MNDLNRALIVPAEMAALCVGETDINGSSENPYGTKDFTRLAADFSLLPYAENGRAHNEGPYVSSQVLADSFQNVSDPLDIGIHLHWALPSAIAHGYQSKDDVTIKFPAAPNRWFVVRIATNSKDMESPETSLNAWVIESDRLWDRDELSDDTPVQNAKSLDTPLQPMPTTDNNKSTKVLGRVFDYNSWAEDGSADRLPLTAIGYGEPAFAAAYGLCPNVFGFWDTMSDLSTDRFPPAYTRVSYMVVGWYADSDEDLLRTIGYPKDSSYEEKLELIAARYRWVFAGGGEETVPDRTLVNAMITDIPWDRKRHFLSRREPGANTQIAAGNTTSEALSALIAAQPEFASLKNVEIVLNALQVGVLNRMNLPGGLAAIDEALHQKDFASTSHGLIWKVEPKTDEAGTNELVNAQGRLRSEAQRLSNLPENVADQLNRLNIAQHDVDQANADIVSLRQRIFSDWVRTMKIEYSPLPPNGIEISANDARSFVENEVKFLDDRLSDLAGLEKTVAQEKQDLNALLSDDFTLSSTDAARFWNPADPVVLYSGSDFRPNDRYRKFHKISEVAGLACRLAGKVISEMGVRNTELGISSRQLPALPLPAAFVFSEELLALLGEAFFIDSNQSSLLCAAVAELGGSDNPAVGDAAGFIKNIEAAQKALFAGGSDDDPVFFKGVAPSPVSFRQWVSPWIPIIMQWETTHFPNTLPPYAPDFIVDNYELAADDIDLVFKHPVPVDKSFARSYQGTIVLGANSDINIKNQISQYLKNFPDQDPDGELQKIADKLDLSMLSQTISGFNEAFLMLDRVLQMAVSDPLGILKGIYFSNFSNVLVNNAVGNENRDSPLSNNTFVSIRSGAIEISRLRIVDAFGQAIDIEKPEIIRAESMVSSKDEAGLLNLPLRYTQPARLLFRWLSAKDDLVEMNSHPASTPVFGWVLFNHLDESLVVYDGAGNALGSFNMLGSFWQGAPGNQQTFGRPIEEVFANANAHLRNFALGINSAADPKKYLKDMLASIDDSTVFISPSNYKQESGLAVLIGRPLALVRASLKLDLLGMPAMNQSKESFAKAIESGDPSKRADGAAPQVSVPVRLGELSDIDDGMVGYFVDEGSEKSYRSFYSPAAPKDGQNGVTRPSFDQVTVHSDPQASPVFVSMLMDPHASVHATTGMLPMKELVISPGIISDDLSAMAVTFLTTPVVSPLGPQIPIPAESGYSWRWVTMDEGSDEWTISGINPDGPGSTLAMNQQQAVEGWLKLQKQPGVTNK